VSHEPLPRAAPAPSPAIEILVVDADAAIRSLVKDALESERRFKVSTASGGPAAHAALRQSEIGLVLLDGRLPGVPGTQAVASHADNLGIPVIVMAADPSRIRPNRGVVRGVLAKPFRTRELADLVTAALAIARRRKRVLVGLVGRSSETRH
jgi:DNA-binding response OmpR family regulator